MKNEGFILIIEDEQIVAENLAGTIESQLFINCEIVDSEAEAIAFHRDHNVLLIISDINLYGKRCGPDIVKTLQAIKPTPVIYLTAYSEDQVLQAALDTKPVAYVLKPYLERQILISVKMALSTDQEELTEDVPKPTQRETEIIQLIAEGLSSRKIGERLFISEHTVSTHRKNVLKRYGMISTVELVAFAIKNKWIKP